MSQSPRQMSPLENQSEVGAGARLQIGPAQPPPRKPPQKAGAFKTLDPPISQTAHSAAFTHKLNVRAPSPARQGCSNLSPPFTGFTGTGRDIRLRCSYKTSDEKQDRGLEAIWGSWNVRGGEGEGLGFPWNDHD